MEETKEPKSAVNVPDAAKKEHEERQAEATSGETLHDLKATESEPKSEPEGSESSSVPSPDGQYDEQRGGRDDAGPM